MTTGPSFLAASSRYQFYRWGNCGRGSALACASGIAATGVGHAALLLFVFVGRGLSLLSGTRGRHADALSPKCPEQRGNRTSSDLTSRSRGTMATGRAEEQEIRHLMGGTRRHDHQWERRISIRSARKEGPKPLFCQRRRLCDQRFGAAEGNSVARKRG